MKRIIVTGSVDDIRDALSSAVSSFDDDGHGELVIDSHELVVEFHAADDDAAFGFEVQDDA